MNYGRPHTNRRYTLRTTTSHLRGTNGREWRVTQLLTSRSPLRSRTINHKQLTSTFRSTSVTVNSLFLRGRSGPWTETIWSVFGPLLSWVTSLLRSSRQILLSLVHLTSGPFLHKTYTVQPRVLRTLVGPLIEDAVLPSHFIIGNVKLGSWKGEDPPICTFLRRIRKKKRWTFL